VIAIALLLYERGRHPYFGFRLKPKDLPFVPLGFAKLMKINPPPKNIKSFNERQVSI
jgi:hypothetical protein